MLEKTLKTILSDRQTLCLIIDEKHQLLHVYGNCEGIFTVPQDKLTREVVQIIVPSLKRLLNTALHRAKEHKPQLYRGINLDPERENTRYVNLKVSY